MQKPPRYSGTASTPVRKEALAAIEEIAASDLAMEQELADLPEIRPPLGKSATIWN